MSNPYSPPSSSTSARSSDFAFYLLGHIAWGAFLGSPVAGGILIVFNYYRMVETLSGHLALFSGFILPASLMVVTCFLPDDFPNSLVPISYTFGMYQATKLLQGDDYSEYLVRGGDKGSAWGATGIGLICLLIVGVLLFAVIVSPTDEWIPQ